MKNDIDTIQLIAEGGIMSTQQPVHVTAIVFLQDVLGISDLDVIGKWLGRKSIARETVLVVYPDITLQVKDTGQWIQSTPFRSTAAPYARIGGGSGSKRQAKCWALAQEHKIPEQSSTATVVSNLCFSPGVRVDTLEELPDGRVLFQGEDDRWQVAYEWGMHEPGQGWSGCECIFRSFSIYILMRNGFGRRTNEEHGAWDSKDEAIEATDGVLQLKEQKQFHERGRPRVPDLKF